MSLFLNQGWDLTIPLCSYLIICILVSLIVRFTLAWLKVWTVKNEKHSTSEEVWSESDNAPEVLNKEKGLWKCWSIVFRGVGAGPDFDDYFVPFFLGFAEICAYPVLMRTETLEVIGGWIAIKTAGHWGGWEKSRPAFNRFLFGNLLIIVISYIWLSTYITLPDAPTTPSFDATTTLGPSGP